MKRRFAIALLVLLPLVAAFKGCGGSGAKHGEQLAFEPSSSAGVTSYNIYRDGVRVGSTAAIAAAAQQGYFDAAPAGSHTWFVTAVRDGDESVPSNTWKDVVP